MNGCGVVLRVESDKSCQEFSSIQLSSSQLEETLLCFVDNVLKKLEVSLTRTPPLRTAIRSVHVPALCMLSSLWPLRKGEREKDPFSRSL